VGKRRGPRIRGARVTAGLETCSLSPATARAAATAASAGNIGCLAHHYMARLFKAALLWPLDDSQTDPERERLDQSLEAGATARSLAGLGSSTAEGLEERHSEDFDPGLMSSPRERGVPGHEWRGERLRERNVDRVVGREVMTQRPDPVHEQMMRIAL